MDAPKIVSQLEVVSRLENDIDLAFATHDEYITQLGHSEVKRLTRAELRYPKEDYDYSGESEAFIRCYSASKNVKDSLVGMGVEVVITKLIEQQQAAQGNVPVVEESGQLESLSSQLFTSDIDDEASATHVEELLKQLPKAAPKKRKTKKAE